jgi:hypothetical protein
MNKSIMERMVFVTGFARGGTSWLRDCIGSHPDVEVLPRERVVFRDMKSADEIRRYFETETAGIPESSPYIVNKAPANAPHLKFAAKSFPESKFIFIIRDPRDVLVSHQRGTQEWMGGANSTVEGCMKKLEGYFKGWQEAQALPNVLLVRYEDLHQNFYETMEKVFAHIGVKADAMILQDIFKKNNFQVQTSRSNVEDRAAAKRKGVIGEWANHLTEKEVNWYKKSKFFKSFMADHQYGWHLMTYENILNAMKEADVNFLSYEDILNVRLDTNRVNVVLQHDVDYLTKPWCIESVRKTADIDAKMEVSAGYNFLPLDDRRYESAGKQAVIDLMQEIKNKSASHYIGLHVNACEKYYPASTDEALGEAAVHMPEILGYLKTMVDDYAAEGVSFRLATSHGYGRGKKLPNNRDTPEIAENLKKADVLLFDTEIRPKLMAASVHTCALTDIGGVLKPRSFNNGYELTDKRAYTSLPKGTFLRFLTHPGNYLVTKPATIVMRDLG